MLRNTTPEEVQAACAANNITQVDHHRCGICNFMVSYYIKGDKLYFDASCDCTSDNAPIERPWSNASDWINMQSREDIKAKLAKSFGVDLEQAPAQHKKQKVKIPEFVCLNRELFDSFKGALYTISCQRPSFKNTTTTTSMTSDEITIHDVASIATSMRNKFKEILELGDEFDWQPTTDDAGESFSDRLVYLRGHYPSNADNPDVVIIGTYEQGGHTEGWVDTAGCTFYAVDYSLTPPIPACVLR